MSADLEIRTVVSAPFDENAYVVWRPGRADALVIDPGTEPDLILDQLRELGLTAAAVVNTHGHVDHIAGNAALKRAFPGAPLIIGLNDAPLLTDPVLNLSAYLSDPVVSPPADRTVREGDRLDLAGIELEVLDIPGHSPGHVVYVVRGAGGTVVLGGDVLFRGGIGRTDFPGGSLAQLLGGIRAKLWPLPGGSVVYPGHGPVTTVGHEKRTNPFLQEG
jgi:glyoxylase-like metal-dependent hydrolase (beta-lactamase superfamily II)